MEQSFDVIVIGGGPGGSTTAALLARSGRRVLVLEKARFPRFHIGESITAFGTDLFKDLGVYERLKGVNQIRKRGLEFVLHGRSKRLYFPSRERDEDGHLPWAFQMPRSKLDQVLLDNAREKGADVRMEQQVKRVLFEEGRAVGVEWLDHAGDGELRRARARWVVDASGQSGVLNRQLRGNCVNHHLLRRKVAVYAHFRGEFEFQNTDEEIHFKLCVHRNGRDWAWYLPVERNLVSLGVVLTPETVKSRRGDLEQLFFEAIEDVPFLCEFVKQRPFELVGSFKSVVDYSYSSKRFAGPGWALVGDSAGFIDPVFSTGLQITFNSAYKLAGVLDRALAEPAAEERALAAYAKDLDRFYRVNGTLVHLFYTAQIDPEKYENAWYMWTHIRFASWKYRLLYLFWGARLLFVREKLARRWGEEVVFGNPGPDNLVARMFVVLSRNFDAAYQQEIQAAEERVDYIEQEA